MMAACQLLLPALEGAHTSTCALGPRALPTTAAGRLLSSPKHCGSLLGMPAGTCQQNNKQRYKHVKWAAHW